MMRFVRANAVRIVIGAVLVAVLSSAVFVWMPYQHELRIARKIESRGGYVLFGCYGPGWIPDAIQYRLVFWNRIDCVVFENEALPPDLLSELESLTKPYELLINNVELTDKGLDALQGLKCLSGLSLRKNQITDSGLEHFKQMTNLKGLDLSCTETTAEGRAMLRKALPNCTISPDP